MIKKLTFGIITLLLVSCGVDHTDFSGNWIDKKNESDKMIIKKNGDNYIVENREKKYPAKIKDGLLEISAELPITATIDENDFLIVGGKEYIRFEKAIRPKFEGRWKISYSENPNTGEKMDITTPEFITITNSPRGRTSIGFDGHPDYPQKYNSINYANGVISYNLRYRDESGWNNKKNMTFELIGNDKIKTQHNFTSDLVVYVKQ